MEYMSVKEAADKWNVSVRRVQVYCSENRIMGLMRIGNVWAIPKDATKPTDPRKEKHAEDKGV